MLEALKTEGNSDYSHTAKQACEEIARRKLPAGKYHPDDICDRMLIEMRDNGLSKRRKRKPSRLKALLSERDTDDGYRQQYTGKEPIECRKNSSEQYPDKITETRQNDPPFYAKSERILSRLQYPTYFAASLPFLKTMSAGIA